MRLRRKAREIALQVLYQLDVLRIEPREALELFWLHFSAAAEAREFASELVEGTWAHRDAIDQLISTCSENWTLERMARVDRNILRLAVYELLYGQGIPPKVALNEAIDLGKEFGSENSGSFINGILDALYSKLRKDHADQADNGEPGPACS
ncbi:MAG: transcription antitermination factor NusB [Syntrophaceae bacterium]|jgi:N utilization substance protein B|nr:transcription antitermination factor NusB [Syntrophaceae bacterium]